MMSRLYRLGSVPSVVLVCFTLFGKVVNVITVK